MAYVKINGNVCRSSLNWLGGGGIIGLLVFMRGVPEMVRFFSAINQLSVQSVDKLHR